MIFSSFEFIFFFLPVLIPLYYFVFRRSMLWKNTILLTASLLFYAWGEPLFVFAMIACIFVNWGFGYLCIRARGDGTKPGNASLIKLLKPVMILTVAADLGLLLIFKYAAFFTENINYLLPAPLPVPQLALPIGISFFVFQAVSYTVDVYRKKVNAQKCLYLVALYISLFPQLMAGPIVR